mmetsp:Transcript_94863/g.159377  ORF Transcript_94863/g.159377 Transcript_94863/m.159377 type:complete len:141 (-) Transcript_94863:140-562(-)
MMAGSSYRGTDGWVPAPSPAPPPACNSIDGIYRLPVVPLWIANPCQDPAAWMQQDPSVPSHSLLKAHIIALDCSNGSHFFVFIIVSIVTMCSSAGLLLGGLEHERKVYVNSQLAAVTGDTVSSNCGQQVRQGAQVAILSS